MEPRIVISGGSGLIGNALIARLRDRGFAITQLVRRTPADPDEVEWNPGVTPLDPIILDGAAAVIALGGASVGRLPWTSGYKHTLLDSRLAPTHALVAALLELGQGAPHFISASAVGYYGNAPGEELTEQPCAGVTFLAQLCAVWEAAAREAEAATDVTLLRTAPIIDPDGVLKPLLLLTKLGLAGPLGGGRQYLPWISLADEVGAIVHVVENRISGPVNLAGPQPSTANELGQALASEMRRPFWFPTPAWLMKTVLGRDAVESLLTADARVIPQVLTETGYHFEHPTVRAAVASALNSD